MIHLLIVDCIALLLSTIGSSKRILDTRNFLISIPICLAEVLAFCSSLEEAGAMASKRDGPRSERSNRCPLERKTNDFPGIESVASPSSSSGLTLTHLPLDNTEALEDRSRTPGSLTCRCESPDPWEERDENVMVQPGLMSTQPQMQPSASVAFGSPASGQQVIALPIQHVQAVQINHGFLAPLVPLNGACFLVAMPMPNMPNMANMAECTADLAQVRRLRISQSLTCNNHHTKALKRSEQFICTMAR